MVNRLNQRNYMGTKLQWIFMDKFMNRSCADPNSPQAARTYKHWLRTFTNIVDSLPAEPAPNKLNLLINYVAANVYDYIAECTSFEIALQTLETMYIKPKNEIFALHLLATCKQRPCAGQRQDICLALTVAEVVGSDVDKAGCISECVGTRFADAAEHLVC